MSQLLSDTDLPAPVGDRWFEDYVPGSVYEFGHVSLSEDEIVTFAQTYDPQRIHTDPAWAATGPFGGLIASGMQTMAATMRLYVEHYVSQVASLASPRPLATRCAPRCVRGTCSGCVSPSATHDCPAPSRTAGWCTRASRSSTRTTTWCSRSGR